MNNIEIILTRKEIVKLLRSIEYVSRNKIRNVKVTKDLKEIENKLRNKLYIIKDK